MNSYLLIKTLHISCAIATGLGFSLRGYWMLTGSPLLQARLTRVLPHVVDSVLLISAIALVVISRQYPFAVAWVTLKLGLLLVYIVLGSYALKRGATLASRQGFLVASIGTIAAIFAVALLKPGF